MGPLVNGMGVSGWRTPDRKLWEDQHEKRADNPFQGFLGKRSRETHPSVSDGEGDIQGWLVFVMD